MIYKFIIKIIIISSFFVNCKVNADYDLKENNDNLENPYLNKSKKFKQINFDELREIIKKNNYEKKAVLERFNQSAAELKATLKLRYPTIDLQSNGLLLI